MSKSVLVLGGSGFLGQAIIRCFLGRNSGNIVCADLTRPSIENLDFVRFDVLREWKNQLTSRFDWVLNCTGQITTPITKCLEVNSLGMTNICEMVHSTGAKLLHVSTVAVFGTVDVAQEDTPLNPISSYATCKSIAEILVKKYLNPSEYGILRLSNLYGENQAKGIVSYLYRSFMSDRKLEFDNDGSLTRYFLHVDDAAEAICQIIQNDITGVFNFVGRDRYSIHQLIELIQQKKGIRFVSSFSDSRPIENIGVADGNAIELKLGVKPRHALSEFVESYFV